MFLPFCQQYCRDLIFKVEVGRHGATRFRNDEGYGLTFPVVSAIFITLVGKLGELPVEAECRKALLVNLLLQCRTPQRLHRPIRQRVEVSQDMFRLTVNLKTSLLNRILGHVAPVPRYGGQLI